MKFIFHLDQATKIEIMIINLAGERIAWLNEDRPAGPGQSMMWTCKDVAPGIYIVQVLKNGKKAGRLKVAVVK